MERSMSTKASCTQKKMKVHSLFPPCSSFRFSHAQKKTRGSNAPVPLHSACQTQTCKKARSPVPICHVARWLTSQVVRGLDLPLPR